jgi:carbon monoxide dehydrogenase subunit G
MARLDLRQFIRATPEQIWPILSDFSTQQRWMVDLRSLEITTPLQSGIGTEFDVTSELFGMPVVKDRMEITSWQPPFRYDVKHKGSFTGTGCFMLEPVPGGTVFTWIEEFKPPAGPLGELGFSFVIGPHLRNVFRRSMDNVRRLAEAG